MTAKEQLRQLPKVDDLLRHIDLADVAVRVDRTVLTMAIRTTIDGLRAEILAADGVDEALLTTDAIITGIRRLAEAHSRAHLRPVINATGVVLHTNLGRAPLAEPAIAAMVDIARHYNTLEYDLSAGARGSRYSHIDDLICQLTGAEAAMVVNNNAAAVMLMLSAVAKGKQVVVSRGELVEIGGSFRVPDIMKQSGAELVEVGTTNKTHLRDYATAICPQTGLLLKVHTSNYRIMGFTADVALGDMVSLGREHDVPVAYDLGCGLVDHFDQMLFQSEATVINSVAAGADIICFSGDKLLGGPQAGIIIGKSSYISRMKQHPLTRALRIDKLTLAGLEATLRLYRNRAQVLSTIPILSRITGTSEHLASRAKQLAHALISAECSADVSLQAGSAQVGGGAMPTVELPATLVCIQPYRQSVNAIEAKLRALALPIIIRIYDDAIYLDVRTIEPDCHDYIVETFKTLLDED